MTTLTAPFKQDAYERWLDEKIPLIFAFGTNKAFEMIKELCLSHTREEIQEHSMTFYANDSKVRDFFNAVVDRCVAVECAAHPEQTTKEPKKKVVLENGAYFS